MHGYTRMQRPSLLGLEKHNSRQLTFCASDDHAMQHMLTIIPGVQTQRFSEGR
jgi:hypothetical protein